MSSGVRDGIALMCIAAAGVIVGLLVGGDVAETAYGVSGIVALIGLGLIVTAVLRQPRKSPPSP